MERNTNNGNAEIKWNMLGTTDTSHTCELCGKTNLKKVVVIEHVETFEVKRVGCDCAGNLLFGKKTRGNTKRIQKRADIVALARKWLAAGHAPEVVVKGVGGRGWPCGLRNGKILIGNFATINVK